MPNILGQLRVELLANTASFVGDMGKASYVAKQAAKSISRDFESLGKIASSTFGPFYPESWSSPRLATRSRAWGVRPRMRWARSAKFLPRWAGWLRSAPARPLG